MPFLGGKNGIARQLSRRDNRIKKTRQYSSQPLKVLRLMTKTENIRKAGMERVEPD